MGRFRVRMAGPLWARVPGDMVGDRGRGCKWRVSHAKSGGRAGTPGFQGQGGHRPEFVHGLIELLSAEGVGDTDALIVLIVSGKAERGQGIAPDPRCDKVSGELRRSPPVQQQLGADQRAGINRSPFPPTHEVVLHETSSWLAPRARLTVVTRHQLARSSSTASHG